MLRHLKAVFSFIIRPFIFFFNLPGRKNASAETTNIRKMPYSFSSLSQKEKSSLFSKLKLFSFRTIIREMLKAVLNERKRKSIASLMNVLPDDSVNIVDIGAADGIDERWQLMMNELGKKFQIHLFEPEQESFQRLQKMFAGNRQVKCYDCALSENGGELELNIVEWPRASSIYTSNQEYMNDTFLKDHFKLAAQVKMDSKRLQDVLNGVEISFLKADVEGYELPILIGSGSLLDNCIGLELEVNFNQNVRHGMPLFSDVDAFCRQKGFTLIALSTPGYLHYLLPDGYYESRGFIYASDALFLRLPEDVIKLIMSNRWPISKLPLAACIYLAYGNYEMAFQLIRKAVEVKLITETDAVYQAIFEAVRLHSGYDRIVSYRKLKSIMTHMTKGASENDTLDF